MPYPWRSGIDPYQCRRWRSSGFLLLLARPLPGRVVLLLLGAAHRKAAGRHVAGDGRAGRDGGAAAHGHRRDELRVGTDEDAVLEHGAVLRGAIVVAEDRAGADVDVRAHGAVAEIGQVIGLAALADRGLLDLDEVADVHGVVEHGVRAHARERPDDAVAAGLHRVEHRVRLDARAG